jgi:NAD+ synthase
MKNLNYSDVENKIVSFLKDNAKKANVEGYVVGISGGVDSAVASTLAAKTGLKVYLLQMPIKQKTAEVNRATAHIYWLIENFPNVFPIECELTSTFDSFLSSVEKHEETEKQHMAEANTRSRLRMTALYYHASIKKCLVLGTGNKVEDFGVGFFTKYGDGGVDVSPIGDLMKSEVRELGKHMGVFKEIVDAKPTDGLWEDGRGDEDQLGATYDELEVAMKWIDENPLHFSYTPKQFYALSNREQEVVHIYKERYFSNRHKILPIPVCNLNDLRE